MQIKLYFDTIKRIPFKQNIFLIKEKILKRIYFPKISFFEEIESKFFLIDVSITFQNNLLELRDKENQQNYWDLGISQKDFHHHYDIFVRETLRNYKLSGDFKNLDMLWEKKCDDIEFIYNLQRMYKFCEIMNSLHFNDIEKITVVNSWIQKFPPKKGLAWTGFNCSIRLINLVKILSSLNEYDRLKNTESKIIFLSIFQNMEFIEKNIEHHIPGNHTIFQYFAIWLLSFLFEDSRITKYSKLFEYEFKSEFLESGLHFELSTHYHLQVLQLGVYYYLINSNLGKKKPLMYNKIVRAYHVFDSFSFSENNLPLIGDNCYNFFHNNLVEDAENLNYLRNILNINREKENCLYEIKNQYVIIRKNKSKLIFDIGNIGMFQNPGHGHSDVLSIIFSYNDIPIFIDPGTKRYSNLLEDLKLKKASSHNTISINGEDQSKLWGFFRWAFLPDKTIFKYKESENSLSLEASFLGFKSIGGAVHFRKIVLNDSELVITDNIRCNNLKIVEQNFILSDLVIFKEKDNKYYLNINNYKFELMIDSKEIHHLEVLPQKIYKSYDNPSDSYKIKIIYSNLLNEMETNIKLKLINE